MQTHHFPDITLLVTHYNRSASLQNMLQSFRVRQLSFGGIVVSDDGSQPLHFDKLQELQKEFGFTLVPAVKNGGLGKNLNKGQDAVKTAYTLYVQEDFEATDKFPGALTAAHQFMQEDQTLDLARFYAYIPYPYLEEFKEGFSKIIVPPLALKYRKIYAYSDHPHLRRSNFFDKFGRYPEGIKGDLTEYKMCISFLQNKGKAIFYNHFTELFVQKNSSAEPSTMTRSNFRQSNNFFISIVRDVYRQIKYNYDILFMKSLKYKD
jgi:glycosyltransferase involved in cell wall biosynthesis